MRGAQLLTMPSAVSTGWVPDREITPELVAPVIAAQFPGLAQLPVMVFDQGWDNAVLAVGDRWLFRFIHRAIALDGARRELDVLREVGPHLPLPVPRPRFIGRPTPELPWPFWGAERLPGVELASLDLTGVGALGAAGRAEVAGELGGFLRELHRPEHAVTAGRLGLPVDPVGRGDPRRQSARAAERIAELRAAGLLGADREVDEVVAAAAALDGPAGPVGLVHGDLHLRHVLVSPGAVSHVSGVIDWGDTSLADPAVDLMIAFAGFDGPARAAFVEAYGQIGDVRALHARVTALAVTAALTLGAAATGPPALLAAGIAALARAAR